jgi:hypothetical protein
MTLLAGASMCFLSSLFRDQNSQKKSCNFRRICPYFVNSLTAYYMGANSEPSELTLQIDAGPSSDIEELDQLSRLLRSEIEELGVESIELIKDTKPPVGTKSAEAVTLGAMALAILPKAVPNLITLLQQWVMRAQGRKVSIKTKRGNRSVEVEYGGSMSPAELKSVVRDLAKALESEK